MAANTTPRFPLTPNFDFAAPLATANTAMDGTGTVSTAFTAGTDGARVDYIKFKPVGTNVASVARIFVNNGSTNATATNNVLIGEVTLPATTASAVATLGEIVYSIDTDLDGGFKLLVTIGTTVASGWQPSVSARNY